MLILNRENLRFELKIESLEDLWILSQFISPQDRVFGKTERKVKIGGENSTKQVKKIIFVELLTKKANFESNILRISGEIQNETEFTAIGQSHTLNFQVGDKIEFEKKTILDFEEKLLDRSINSKKSKNLLLLFDKDDLIAAEFGEFSYSVIFEERGLGSKKYIAENINEDEQRFKVVEDLLKRDYSNIVFAGPGHWKENFKKYVKDKSGIESISYAFSDVSASAISRVIKEILKSGLLMESQLKLENDAISSLLENINKGEKYSYGYENVQDAINMGRSEDVLISTDFIEQKRDEGDYSEINELMKTTEQLNGNLVIINSKNDSGKILDGLGGIASILRY